MSCGTHTNEMAPLTCRATMRTNRAKPETLAERSHCRSGSAPGTTAATVQFSRPGLRGPGCWKGEGYRALAWAVGATSASHSDLSCSGAPPESREQPSTEYGQRRVDLPRAAELWRHQEATLSAGCAGPPGVASRSAGVRLSGQAAAESAGLGYSIGTGGASERLHDHAAALKSGPGYPRCAARGEPPWQARSRTMLGLTMPARLTARYRRSSSCRLSWPVRVNAAGSASDTAAPQPPARLPHWAVSGSAALVPSAPRSQEPGEPAPGGQGGTLRHP